MEDDSWIKGKVAQYLNKELVSGDPSKIRAAKEAIENNRRYGIGGWTREYGGVMILKASKTKTLASK